MLGNVTFAVPQRWIASSYSFSFDAVRGIAPQVDQIMVLWDGFGEFTGSEIYTQLPEGSTVSRM